MQTGLRKLTPITEVASLTIEVTYEEWSNIHNGRMRAVVLSGADRTLEGKTVQVLCRGLRTGDAIDMTECIVKSVATLQVGSDACTLVSLQPVSHRRREINQRKAYRQLHRAYERVASERDALAMRLLQRRKAGR